MRRLSLAKGAGRIAVSAFDGCHEFQPLLPAYQVEFPTSVNASVLGLLALEMSAFTFPDEPQLQGDALPKTMDEIKESCDR